MRKRKPPLSPIVSSKREKKNTSAKPTISSKISERCLNDLAWLLETSPSSCAAVCMVGRTLMIADNAIYAGSKGPGNNKDVFYKHKFIKDIRRYLNTKKFDGRLGVMKSIFEHVFMTKAPLLSKGDIVAPFKKSEIKEIVAVFIKSPNKPTKELINSLSFSHNREKVSHLFQMASKIKRRLFRFMSNLSHRDNTDLLSSLFHFGEIRDYKMTSKGGILKKDKKLIVEDKKPMVFILKIDKKSVHAELKIVDMLVGLGLISLKEVGENKYIIGVSKKCCPQCDSIIKTVNKKSKSKAVITSGAHAVVTKKWKPPMFCVVSKSDDTMTVARDNELINQVMESFKKIDFESEDEHDYMSQESEGELDLKSSLPKLTDNDLLSLIRIRFKENPSVLKSVHSLDEEIKKVRVEASPSKREIIAVRSLTTKYCIFKNVMKFLQMSELLKLRLVDKNTKKLVDRHIDSRLSTMLKRIDLKKQSTGGEEKEDVGHMNVFN